jgi:hypothetical protein
VASLTWKLTLLCAIDNHRERRGAVAMIGRDTNRGVGIDQTNASQNASLYSANGSPI